MTKKKDPYSKFHRLGYQSAEQVGDHLVLWSDTTGHVVIPNDSAAYRRASEHMRFCTSSRFGVVMIRLQTGRAPEQVTSVAHGFVVWLSRRHHLTSGKTTTLRLNLSQELRTFLAEYDITLSERQSRSLFEGLRKHQNPDGSRFIRCVKRSGAAPAWEVTRPLSPHMVRRTKIGDSANGSAPSTTPVTVQLDDVRAGQLIDALRALRDGVDDVLRAVAP